MTLQETNLRIEQVFQDPWKVKEAIEHGVADAVRHYAHAGELMAAYRDGKIVWVDPVTFAEVRVNSEVAVAQS
jgi:hypothetical protein